jgi:trigger factor
MEASAAPTVEQLDGDRVRLTVEVPAHDVHHAVAHATHDLAERVKIPGFRRGKVPAPVLVSRVGKERVYTEAVESHIGSWFWTAARRSRVRPVEEPAFDYELPETDDESWRFTAEFAVQAHPEPADWTQLEVPKRELDVDPELVSQQLEVLQRMVADLAPVEGRAAQGGDVAVVDIISDDGPGQRDYVVELGAERLVDEIEDGIVGLLPGESRELAWELGDGSERHAQVTLKELYERVLPPLEDDLARAASEFDTVDALRGDIEGRIRTQLDDAIDGEFRARAIDELVSASNVQPAGLVVEVRTRELLNAFVRSLEQRGIDPASYLQLTGISGPDLEGGETDEDIEEIIEAGGADRVRQDLRLKSALDRIAAEVKPISPELAEAREKIWTPEQERQSKEMKLWTPGSKEN